MAGRHGTDLHGGGLHGGDLLRDGITGEVQLHKKGQGAHTVL